MKVEKKQAGLEEAGPVVNVGSHCCGGLAGRFWRGLEGPFPPQ